MSTERAYVVTIITKQNRLITRRVKGTSYRAVAQTLALAGLKVKSIHHLHKG